MYIYKENGGVSSARNIGLQHAKGTYIMFVDQDDEINRAMVERLYIDIETHSVDLSMCNCILKYDFKDERLIWENNLKFDEKIHIREDLLFICKYAEKCKKFYYDYNEYLYYYYIRNDSALRQKYSIKKASVLYTYHEVIDILNKYHINNKVIDNVVYSYIFDAMLARIELNKINKLSKETKEELIKIRKKYIALTLFKSKIKLKGKAKLLCISYLPIIYDYIKRKIKKGRDKKCVQKTR